MTEQKIPQDILDKINTHFKNLFGQYPDLGSIRAAYNIGATALYQHLKPLLDAEDEEINEWQKIKKLGMPEKWIEVYKHYQELLTHEDVANWWQDQFNIANAEREELKSQLSMKGQEIERLKSEIEFRQGL